MAGETIERAAIRDDEGFVYDVPRPGRHHDVINHMIDDAGFPPPVTGEQGFTTSTGRFVGREEAMQIAGAAISHDLSGQIGRPSDKHPVTAETYRAMISASVVE